MADAASSVASDAEPFPAVQNRRMKEAIGQALPFAVGIAISPLPIVAVVLMLATPRARSNGPAYVVGGVAGLAIVGAIVLLVSSGADASDDGEPATWVSVLKLVLGALLVLVAVKEWRGRPRRGERAELPAWMAKVDAFGPPKAFAMGALLSGVNPKNLLLLVGGAAAIAQTGIDGGEQAIALAVFVAIGSLGILAPVVLLFALGERSRPMLDGLRSWLAANNAAIMAVIVLIIGAKLVGDGISGL
jgi:threonine/homoserine/homoserine lactone efflux protein